MLLSSLPTSCEHLVTTLLRGKETLEFDEILGSLLDHYQQMQNLGESSGEKLIVTPQTPKGPKHEKDISKYFVDFFFF